MKFKKDIFKVDKQKQSKYLLILFFVLGFVAFFTTQRSKSENNETQSIADIELSTYIPKGHTLIPIELKNSEQLDGVIGRHGIVDLYTNKAGQAILIGKRIRLVRAPHSQQTFAVLVKEKEAKMFISESNELFASVRGHQEDLHEVVEKKKSNVKIEYSKEN